MIHQITLVPFDTDQNHARIMLDGIVVVLLWILSTYERMPMRCECVVSTSGEGQYMIEKCLD